MWARCPGNGITALSPIYTPEHARLVLPLPFLSPWRVSEILAWPSSGYADVSFRSGGRLFHARIPPEGVWTAIKDILVFEEYELLPRFRLSGLHASSTVVDAGAYAGEYSLKASPFCRRVVSLEPSLRNFGFMTRNILTNAVSNISARRVALSSTEGKVPFRDAGNISAVLEGGQRGSYDVPAVTLRMLAEELGRVDLMKLDIEGAELDVLSGTGFPALAKIERIVAEIHLHTPEHRARFRDVLGHLRLAGMEVKVIPNFYQDLNYALLKPWRCPLRTLQRTWNLPFRAFLSGAYGCAHFFPRLGSFRDVGNVVLLFAYRD